MSELEEQLGVLLQVVRETVLNKDGATRQLDRMTDSEAVLPQIAQLADQINHLVVQKEAREFRLEQMIEDLLDAQAAVVEARHDPLTGLPNRGLFHDLLLQACAEAEQQGQVLALMFIDLDRFKQVNDTLGHDAGDELLVQVSQLLCACVREGDILGRLGGDEFTVVLRHLPDRATAIHVAERIIDDLRATFALSVGEAEIGGSIGISFFPDDAPRPVSLLKNADVAMYHAKEAGRNTYRLYRPWMDAKLQPAR